MLRPRSRRRDALRWRAGALLCAGVLAACDPVPTEQGPEPTPSNGRLTARVVAAPTLTVPLGLSVQTITEGGRPFGLYVPSNYTADTTWPVTVLLHGSGASGEGMALDFKDYAEATGLVVLAPNSYSITWDLIAFGQFSVDRTYIDNMLKWAFDHVAADSQRVSISGFSDGAIYAIWLGLKNGDLFSRLGAFTPCLNVPNIRTGTPEIFMSHGLDDQERPIDACSREIAPILVNAGYTVEYVEYPSPLGNGHYMTPEVITQGMTFLAKPVGQ